MMMNFRPIYCPVLLLVSTHVVAVTPEEALHLARYPEAQMIDATICELRTAVENLQTRKLAGPGYGVALFRGYHATMPFATAESGEDSTVTLRFQAKPGELIVGRAAVVDLKKKSVNWGPSYRVECRRQGHVDVRELEELKDNTP